MVKSQNDHATVFFCKDMKCYLMCYDCDLEQLPAPHISKTHYNGVSPAPYRLREYRSGTKIPQYIMRILYKPVTTTRGKAPDGTVDFLAVVNQNWLDRMAWQFEAAFPAGLSDEQLLTASKCEELDI